MDNSIFNCGLLKCSFCVWSEPKLGCLSGSYSRSDYCEEAIERMMRVMGAKEEKE